MSFDWKSAVGKIAPTIATLLGGPLAGTAVGLLSQTLLGKPDGTEPEIAAAVAGATPDQLIALKKADDDFKTQMAQVDLQFEQTASADRDSARKMQQTSKSWLPSFLAILITIGFFGLIAVMTQTRIPDDNRDTLNILIGSLGSAWVGVVSFYFGSSAGSSNKDQTIREALAKK